MRTVRTSVRYSGLGLAALAFGLTRLLVAATLEPDVVSFMVAGVVPLIAGLGLSLFGVALAIGAFSRGYARSVWLWSVVGLLATVAVLGTTAVHSILVGRGMDPLLESGPLVGNALLGGTIAGAVVGDRTARSRRRKDDLARFAERATLVNRLLRHEITNAATVLKGYADRLEDGAETVAVVRDSADRIETTVDRIGEFAAADSELVPVDLEEVLESAVALLPDDVTVATDGQIPDDSRVCADQRLHVLFGQLLETAREHTNPGTPIAVGVDADEHWVTLEVRYDGAGLAASAAEMLETPGLPEHDDPRVGYGLQMVRLLVDHYDGDLAVETGDGTTIAVSLQRATEHRPAGLARGVPLEKLSKAGSAALLAGLVMGVVMEALTGRVPTIGALYGVDSAVVGWITHLFHSVLFGLVFAAALETQFVGQYATTVRRRTALGVAWGVALWLVATGVVMPLWLLAANAPAEFPNVSPVGLVPHVLWGAILGRTYTSLPELGAVGDWLLERLGTS